MRKRINGKINKNRKVFIKLIVILMFLFFTCSVLILSKRKYLYVEEGFKTFSSIINGYVTKNVYSNDKLNSNVTKMFNDELKKENDELRKLLDLNEKNSHLVAALVTNQTFKAWDKKVIINKGYKNGLKKDFPVINSNGLVGFISKASKYISEVNLLTNVSEDNMISVTINTNDGLISGVLSGYDNNKKLFKVSGVISKNGSLINSKVTLSGYGNELYKGIYIGDVFEEEISNYGLTKTIWIKSLVNFDDLLFVMAIKEE